MHSNFRQCPTSLQPIAPQTEHHIHRHLQEHIRRLASATACVDGWNFRECPTWWLRREEAWRARAASAMHLRLCTHARLWGDLLPNSRVALGRQPSNASSLYHGTFFSALDYWEPEYACGEDERVPEAVGDGPKWVCGASSLPQPCTLLSLGSNLDDSFEKAMHAKARCAAHIVDPTLDFFREATSESSQAFAIRLSAYGATLNASVGLGNPNTTGMVRLPTGATWRFPLVSLAQLLRHRYGPAPWQLSALKIDIEGHERSVLAEVFDLCASGQLSIDQMNVELHPWPEWYGQATFRNVRDLHAVFGGALSCGLVLHHKERNLWGCPKGQCIELAWVSLRHAKRVALMAVADDGRSGSRAATR